jgi:large subunit ribosomal protein L15
MKHIGNLSYNDGAKHSRKRIGRGQGSGHGGTSTKGHKGQKSRSGATISRGFEGGQMPINRRVPKYGFTNALFMNHYNVINLSKIQYFIDKGRVNADDINYESLKKAGAINGPNPLKVLAQGEVTSPIKVSAAKVSKVAIEKIEKAGGSVETNG